MYDSYGWRPYVPVAERRRKALQKMESLRKKGRTISPVNIPGRTIAATFWGKAWCQNLESYSDFSNRLPRGRTYLRNGSVVDLQIEAGQITALVSGSEIYTVKVEILPVAQPRWKSICADCAGSIDSLVELLQGRLSKGVMERISRQQTGLFPSPKEIKLSCSCPDWAEMCKHVAAVLYGVGARLDQQPELLFRLRAVNEQELIASAGQSLPGAKQSPSRALAGEDLSRLFGLDMADATPSNNSMPSANATPLARRAPLPQTRNTPQTRKTEPKPNAAPLGLQKTIAALKAAAKKAVAKRAAAKKAMAQKAVKTKAKSTTPPLPVAEKEARKKANKKQVAAPRKLRSARN